MLGRISSNAILENPISKLLDLLQYSTIHATLTPDHLKITMIIPPGYHHSGINAHNAAVADWRGGGVTSVSNRPT